MPSLIYPQLSPVMIPDDPGTASVVDAPSTIATYSVPFAGRLLKICYQVTTTLACDTVAAVISVDKCDYDEASNVVEMGAATLVDATAAANTIYEEVISPAAANRFAAGQCILLKHKTAGTDTGVPAGSVRMWAVVQPEAL